MKNLLLLIISLISSNLFSAQALVISPINAQNYKFGADNQLQKAIEKRNYILIDQLIDQNHQLLNSIPGHHSALVQAVSNDDLKLATLLLAKEGIDVNINSPLSKVKSLAMAELLLKGGANPNLKMSGYNEQILPIDFIIRSNESDRQLGERPNFSKKEIERLKQLFAQHSK